jgi:DNA-binding MarR family transcriptional regulator
MKPGLGTQLRHLLELLDGAVDAAYVEAGIATRPRYTPVFKALAEKEPSTLGQIATAAGITQPAATQTIALMVKDGLVTAKAAPDDGRQRLVRLTKKGRELYPQMQACWAATKLAAESLDDDTPQPLSEALASAIAALQARPFEQRIATARARLAKQLKK